MAFDVKLLESVIVIPALAVIAWLGLPAPRRRLAPALAISTVTAGRIALAVGRLWSSSGALSAFKDVSLVLWALTLMWLPVLLFAEARWPRGYSVRWSTVFPVGMCAACSFVVGKLDSARAITDFAHVWVWVALAVWTLVVTGLARAAARTLADAREHPASSARPA